MRDINFLKAKIEDFEKLAEIRIRAMRPSLEKAGRFNPQRARERLLNSFEPENTIVVSYKDSILGFYMVTEKNESFYLHHLYIDPDYQGEGIGSLLMERIKKNAIEYGKNIELQALKGSPANDFYLSKGFIKFDETEFDNQYRWSM